MLVKVWTHLDGDGRRETALVEARHQLGRRWRIQQTLMSSIPNQHYREHKIASGLQCLAVGG